MEYTLVCLLKLKHIVKQNNNKSKSKIKIKIVLCEDK